jgi:hypothetical protein
MLNHQLFKQDPFVRSMLIDQIESIRSFRNEIRGADLADEAEEGNGGGLRRSNW